MFEASITVERDPAIESLIELDFCAGEAEAGWRWPASSSSSDQWGSFLTKMPPRSP